MMCHFCRKDNGIRRTVPIREGPGGPIASRWVGWACDRDAALLENGRPN